MDARSLLRWNGALPDPRDHPGAKNKAKAAEQVDGVADELADLQERMYAAGRVGERRRVLLILQAMDAGGKDGTVKHVVGLVNPGGVRISSFGKPTKDELAHDFLWRMNNALPGQGELGVFNRSHYEDVLVVRVHDLVPPAVWRRRYVRINTWERRLAGTGCSIVKVFLHISPEEQLERLLARIEDPTKHWKVGAADAGERERWDDYQAAYLAALETCSTDVAPWYVVPADRKWYRDWAVTHLLLETLRDLDLGWPSPAGVDLQAVRAQLKASR